MKKILFVFLFTLGVINVNAAEDKKTFGEIAAEGIETVYSDGKEVVTTLYGDGKDVIKELYPDIKNALKSIGSAIGVAAEHVYTVLVKRYVVEGVTQLLIFIGSIVLLVFGIRGMNRFVKNEAIITWKIAFPIIFSIIGFIMLLCVNYNDMLMGLINPEYGAINYIIEYTQSMIH